MIDEELRVGEIELASEDLVELENVAREEYEEPKIDETVLARNDVGELEVEDLLEITSEDFEALEVEDVVLEELKDVTNEDLVVLEVTEILEELRVDEEEV
ncbi:MAG: hypothetical protein M1818_006993 [Claussenomyces sp. TS43310]|nr:MAG: hypothetical protein M1818_006993 [Claussenomyces sp. TS43310]